MKGKKLYLGESKHVIKTIGKLFVLTLVFSAAGVYAQVARSVNGGEGILWAGGEFASFSPDYGSSQLKGAGASFDFNVTPKIGVIGETRWLRWSDNDGDETQSDYLGGAKYRIWRFRNFDFDAKMLIGGVWIRFPLNIGTGSYFAYAPGAFADYRVNQRWRVRGGYEYQVLPTAPNIPGQPSNGLQPHGFTVGVEYNVLRLR